MDREDRKEVRVMDEEEEGGGTLLLMKEEGQRHSTVERI